jgi:hypothetical protein
MSLRVGLEAESDKAELKRVRLVTQVPLSCYFGINSIVEIFLNKITGVLAKDAQMILAT